MREAAKEAMLRCKGVFIAYFEHLYDQLGGSPRKRGGS